MVILAQGRIEDLLREWQERLRLLDWDIRVEENVEVYGMDDNQGFVEFAEPNKEAVISLLDPSQFVKDSYFTYDVERTLVHELLHLKLCLIDKSESETQNRLVHQIIEDLAKALIDAKRAKTSNEEEATEKNEKTAENSGSDDSNDSYASILNLVATKNETRVHAD